MKPAITVVAILRSSLRTRGDVVIVLLALVLAGGALYKHRWSVSLSRITSAVIRRKLAASFTSRASQRVAFVFRTAECAAKLAQVDSLNRLARLPGYEVVGIMIADPRRVPDWRSIATGNGIEFPVRLGTVDVIRAVSYEGKPVPTPFVVLVDGAGALRTTSATELYASTANASEPTTANRRDSRQTR